ncbi:DUF2911 domain-containing protein [Robiginitalea sp. SC105]|uniref:DUF2911 domain-containing protein n=1 Tax=Robiginitalea sp. SC105 TaxID=2762332 RepID=UPI00163AFE9F|nr:DUF2911 domain-containing protein [Robiginitalea sp. SC105]MBC2840386.1 DUF2911 domain-containing protein [Robiginitalea sp. SC105]
MKKSILLFVALGIGALGFSQIQTPAPSPGSELHQTVGLTEVVVNYSRPSMKGRAIFGGLVPFDAIWRTGANMNTTVSFSDDVKVGGNTLEAGAYALYTKPGPQQWEVYFYTDTNNGGLPQQWDESKVAAIVTVPAMKMEMPVETFTITVDDLTNNGASLGLIWENTYVGIPFEVPTTEKAMRSIEAVMGGPGANQYHSAAAYYLEEGQDLSKAKMWVDKATEMSPDAYWMWRTKSLIYAKMGDTKGAIAAAKKSLEVAQKAGNQDYVRMNQASLKEWGAM